MKKIYHVYILSSLLATSGTAQTVYFQQNFSAGGTPASYVSASPNNTQFDGLSGLSATITNNAVQFSRPTDSGTAYMSRSTSLSGPPTSLHIQFSFELLSSDPAVASTSSIIFYVGSGFNAGVQNPDVAEIYARMGFNFSKTISGRFEVRNMPGQGASGNSAEFAGRQTITFAMNNTGNTLSYVSPTGAQESLPNDTYDIWVGGTRLFNDQPVTSPGQTLANFKFRISNGVGVMQIGNLLMREISGALPVTLLSFTAQPEGDRVQLAWSTAAEQNAEKFVVERSRDLNEFQPIGDVLAKGNTDTRQYYGLTDRQPLPGTNYYRLRQIDVDGTAHIYKPTAAIVRVEDPVVAVLPNPVEAGRVRLRLWNAENATVNLLNTTGQRIPGRLDQRDGNADFIPNQPLPAGLYWLEVKTDAWKRTAKVVVE